MSGRVLSGRDEAENRYNVYDLVRENSNGFIFRLAQTSKTKMKNCVYKYIISFNFFRSNADMTSREKDGNSLSAISLIALSIMSGIFKCYILYANDFV